MTAFLIILWIIFFMTFIDYIDNLRHGIGGFIPKVSVAYELLMTLVYLGVLIGLGYILWQRLMP